MQPEADRRQNLIDDLLTREKQLNATFRGDVTEPESSRSTLMGMGSGTSGGGAANPWLINESEDTRGLTFGEIKQQQQRVIEVQDAGLDALAAVISRHKIMGQDIGNELDEQNDGSLYEAFALRGFPPSRSLLYKLQALLSNPGFDFSRSIWNKCVLVEEREPWSLKRCASSLTPEVARQQQLHYTDDSTPRAIVIQPPGSAQPVDLKPTHSILPVNTLCDGPASQYVLPSWVSLLMKCDSSDEVQQRLVLGSCASDRVVPASRCCCWHPHAHHAHIVRWNLAIRRVMGESL
ncbi:hypothetical protein KUCAC02_015852, partial [Chaenocephalus aceratus]